MHPTTMGHTPNTMCTAQHTSGIAPNPRGNAPNPKWQCTHTTPLALHPTQWTCYPKMQYTQYQKGNTTIQHVGAPYTRGNAHNTMHTMKRHVQQSMYHTHNTMGTAPPQNGLATPTPHQCTQQHGAMHTTPWRLHSTHWALHTNHTPNTVCNAHNPL